MSRRRRRHADPARLPRRDRSGRELREQQERTAAEIARVRDGLSRAIAISLAAIVYFGAWMANAVLDLFPPPQGLDLANPLLLIGMGSVFGATVLVRYLVRAVDLRRLATYGLLSTAGLGALFALFVALFFATGGGSTTLLASASGVAVCWIAATLWMALLRRRARRLLQATAPGTG